MVPIVSIVGKSDSGKTYLLEKLVSILVARGYRIATVKHDIHGFEIDREGKDSWRHKQAGAATVVLSSPTKIAVIKDLSEELDLEQIRSGWINEADLILTEGYKRAHYPKVEVSLFKHAGQLICSGEDRLVAVVCNQPISPGVPVFQESQIGELGDLLEERFLKNRTEPKVQVLIEGKPLEMKPFVQEIVWRTCRGFFSSLKGWDPAGEVVVKISGGDKDGVV